MEMEVYKDKRNFGRGKIYATNGSMMRELILKGVDIKGS